MDESDLFAGIGADPARSQEGTNDRPEREARSSPPDAPRSPDDSVPTPPAKPVAVVTHEHLAAHALCHLQECPMLGATAGALADECLAAGTRFPHTLLVGPADSSKRTIARSIAADMAAPLHLVEMMELTAPDLMHAAFSGIPDGAVVLVSGIDTVSGGALSDLARVASARRSVRRPDFGDMLRRLERDPWRRAPGTRDRARRAYGDFTMVLTARRHVPSDSPLHRWVQLQFFTRRTADTEVARLGRLFRHAGWDLDREVVGTFADFAVRYGIRSLQFVNGLLLALRSHGDLARADGDAGPATLDPETATSVLRHVFRESMDPKLVAEAEREDRRRARRKRAAAKRAAAAGSGSAGAPGSEGTAGPAGA